MKRAVCKKISGKEDMKSEYDFSEMKGAVRGKYYKVYRAGHKVKIHKADGTTSVQHVLSEMPPGTTQTSEEKALFVSKGGMPFYRSIRISGKKTVRQGHGEPLDGSEKRL